MSSFLHWIPDNTYIFQLNILTEYCFNVFLQFNFSSAI